MGSSEQDKKSSLSKFMIIRIGDYKFAIKLYNVREVIANQPMSYLPNMPDHFLGIINLRGKIISIFSLKKCLERLSFKKMKIKRPIIVISSIENNFYGIMVDEVEEVVSIQNEQIDYMTKIENLNNEIFDGVIKFSDFSMAPILKIDKVLKIEDLLDKIAS